MPGVANEPDFGLGATVELLLTIGVLAVIWYPAVHYAIELVPLLVGLQPPLVVGVLAVTTAYPFVAGHWSPGTLGESLFVFLLLAVAVNLLASVGLVAIGNRLPGSSPEIDAILWGGTYVLSYFVVSRIDVFDGD